MKKFLFLILFLVLSSLIIIYGKVEYNKKVQETFLEAQAEVARYNEKLEEAKQLKEQERQNYYLSLVQNMDRNLTDMFLNAVESEEPLQVLAMGSAALTVKGEGTPWPKLVEEIVNEKYGQKVIEVEILSYGSDNTFDVVGNNKHIEAAKRKPDIFILEPFIWNDNGYARIEDTLYHVNEIVKAVKKEREDVTVFIQPPNPIYNAVYFIDQVIAVKDYTFENDWNYFDHWQDWPETDDEELLGLVSEENIPNQEGHTIWANYIASYFAAQ